MRLLLVAWDTGTPGHLTRRLWEGGAWGPVGGCLGLTATVSSFPGNLLSSLMGSSEQEEGEESPSDGSPIELD